MSKFHCWKPCNFNPFLPPNSFSPLSSIDANNTLALQWDGSNTFSNRSLSFDVEWARESISSLLWQDVSTWIRSTLLVKATHEQQSTQRDRNPIVDQYTMNDQSVFIIYDIIKVLLSEPSCTKKHSNVGVVYIILLMMFFSLLSTLNTWIDAANQQQPQGP